MMRGVVFPYSRGGVAAAMILGFGRAIGEAIAVAQVIGAYDTGISINLFPTGNTLGAMDRGPVPERGLELETSSLIYLGLILLVFSIVVNLLAQWIVRRVARRPGAGAVSAAELSVLQRPERPAAPAAPGQPRHGARRVARRRGRRRDPRRRGLVGGEAGLRAR